MMRHLEIFEEGMGGQRTEFSVDVSILAFATPTTRTTQQ